MKHTPAGKKGSTKYNNELRLATLRHAIVGQLRSPPNGFEEVTIRHFAMCRQRIVVQARRWMLEARDSDLCARYEQIYGELLSLLDTESMREYGSLPPLLEDLKALEKLEPSFIGLVGNSNEIGCNEDMAGEEEHMAFNPWAGPGQSNPWAAAASGHEIGNAGNSSDDELYE